MRWKEGEATRAQPAFTLVIRLIYFDDYDDVQCAVAIALFVHNILAVFFRFISFFIFFALMCIAESHSKRCAITINLINCAARGKNEARGVCVCVECGREQIHERHTIYSNFNSILFTFTWAQHKKPSNIAFTQNEKPLVVLFKRYRMCDNSLVVAHMLVLFLSSSSSSIFFQQTENNNNSDFINFVSIRCWFLFFHFYFFHLVASTHTHTDRRMDMTHSHQSIYPHVPNINIRKCI